MVKFISLYSGSDKNSSVFSYRNTNIMIDCGGSFKQLCAQLDKVDMKITDIDGIFLTHSHSDHIKALPMIIKNTNIPIYASYGTHEEIFDMGTNMPKDNRIVIYDNMPFELNNVMIESFKTPHDTKHSIGFNLNFNGKTATYATDVGCITEELATNFKGNDFIFLESNHDVEMLKSSQRPYNIKQRILGNKGHLSNEVSAEFSLSLAKQGLKRIMLGHLSGEANTPELAYRVTEKSYISNDIKPNKDIILKVAPRGELSDMVEF